MTTALALALMAACSYTNPPASPAFVPKPPPKAPQLRIVGVGDSLTAGVQSNGLLGVNAPNPIPSSPFAKAYATQEHGFFALLWQQANPGVNVSDATVSPLPLIAPPGVGTLLVPNNLNQPTPIVAACGPSNLVAYNFGTALSTRLDTTHSPFDVGVPGQTMHEAIYQYQPTGPCNPPKGATGALAPLLMENAYFYPVLGTWGPTITQLQAASSFAWDDRHRVARLERCAEGRVFGRSGRADESKAVRARPGDDRADAAEIGCQGGRC